MISSFDSTTDFNEFSEVVLEFDAVVAVDEDDEDDDDDDVDDDDEEEAEEEAEEDIWSLVSNGDQTPKTTAKNNTTTISIVPNWFVFDWFNVFCIFCNCVNNVLLFNSKSSRRFLSSIFSLI